MRITLDMKRLLKVTFSDLLLRMLHACKRLEPRQAALVGMWFERWQARQPKERWYY